MLNSPDKIDHLLQSDYGDNFVSKYLSEGSAQQRTELIREQLEAEASAINATLASLFPERPKIGLLFSNDPREAQRTLDTVRLLLSQRQRDIENKNEVYANQRRTQAEKTQLSAQLQKAQRDLKRSETERENVIARLKALEKSSKEISERLTAEKQEWAKKYRAIEARENQYINASRKQEQTIKTLQDKISRGQDKTGFRNNFEVMAQLQASGPTFVMVNAEHQYNQVVARTMEENYNAIAQENQFLKDTLQNIQRELQTVLDLKCETLKRRRGYDSEIDTTFELLPLKPQLLNLPTAYSRQPITTLTENVHRFKDAMRTGQALDEKQADQKVACVNNVKNLIRNYKNVIESQQQLLSRVILKAKQFKSAEIQAAQSRARGASQDEIDRARRFLQEQNAYLQGKNRELELTRKAMSSTIRKVQTEREQFSRRAGQATQEMQRIQRQIEQLPAIVEQQLNL